MGTWPDQTASRYLSMVGIAVGLRVSWIVVPFVLVLGRQTFLMSLLGGSVLLVVVRLDVWCIICLSVVVSAISPCRGVIGYKAG